ncbi:hypothetical protein BSNK01_11090 [Bacillaceae bacterium]
MNDSETNQQIGQVVRSLRGRDAGKYAIVIGVIDEKFVLIADGDKRKFDKPKKKNVHHLEWMGQRFDEVAESLKTNGRVPNAKLRHLLRQFVENQAEVPMKGE